MQDLHAKVRSLQGALSHFKGVAAEQWFAYQLMRLGGHNPKTFLLDCPDNIEFGPFREVEKRLFNFGGNQIEVDAYARHRSNGPDLIAEVKDWQTKTDMAAIEKYIATVETLRGALERATLCLFYSANGFSPAQLHALKKADILAATAQSFGAS